MKGLAVVSLTALFVVTTIASILELPRPAVNLPAAVSANMALSGVEHPVTAVLLNFRGYDTLLEVGVLLLALIVVLTASTPRDSMPLPPVQPVLQALPRIVVPVMVLFATYLLWAGAYQPGGAFQGGAVLAAAAVLLRLTGIIPGWRAPGVVLRCGLFFGFLVFLFVATASLGQGEILAYPPPWASALIVLIELALTLSLGLILAGLFLFLS